MPTRRKLLTLAGIGVAGLVAARFGLPRLMRRRAGSARSPELEAAALRAFRGLDRKQLWDVHVHVVGLGRGGTGCEVNPRMQELWHPWLNLQYDMYLAAAGVRDEARADQEYMELLLAAHRDANPAGKLVLLAFDRFVAPDGREDPTRTPFHTPNEYVLQLAREHADVEACVSIHPYRRDAVARLEAAAAEGAVAVKWLPAAMGIDPGAARCDPFYAKLAELGLPLLSHAGSELAVETHEETSEFGNPQRLRRALDAGARVIVGHCASAGANVDLDDPNGAQVESFDLFMRMLEQPKYAKLLYGGTSTLTAVNRSGRPLRTLLERGDLHDRLLDGTDYPLVGVSPLFSTQKLVWQGYLTEEERSVCNEAFETNPLLFDFLVKRFVAVEKDGRRLRFAPGVFETRRAFPRAS